MMTKAPKKFLLLYGSQTGQAQSICEEIAETASKHGLEAELHCLSQTDKKFSLERARCLVLVTSTTGDGEPPDTASKFWRRLKKKTLTNTYLQHLSYALLGLGDSNYTNFCNCGKMFDKRLEELGAKRFYNSGWADDGTGLEVVVEPWMDGLWPALKKHLLHTADSTDSAAPVVNGGTNGTDSAAPVVNGGTNGALPVSNGTSDIDPLKSDIQKVRTLKSEEKESLEKLSIDANGGSEALPVPVFDCEMREKFEACLDPSWKEGSRGLRESRQPLCESKLTLPAVPPKYLKINYHPNEVLDTCVLPLHNKEPFPSAKSEVADARIVSATRLTRADAVKTAIDMELDISTAGFHYEPGDSFSIVCPNSTQEVHMLLTRLGLESEADIVFSLEVIEGTKKRTAKVPPFLPARCTLRHALLTSMDIRTPPKKAFLRSLAEYASEASEKRRLEELCSKQGAEDYAERVRKPNLSILDILAAFPSCTPPVERLFEHLPRLQARPYSASSSPLSAPGRLHFVFNILEVPAGEGRCVARKGLCTSWLNSLTQAMQTHSHDTQVEDHMAKLNLSPEIQIPVFSRGNQHFHLPEDLSTPIVMIGPGTGVAPFLGFLQHRQHLHSQAPDTALGESWLFYGCRHKERDFLYRAQMERLSEEGILSKLLVSFSRDGEDGPKYVQDMIHLHGSELVERIYDTETIVYVCGDASNMARNVTETWEQLLQEHKGLSADQARAYLMTMRLKKRYREDIWT